MSLPQVEAKPPPVSKFLRDFIDAHRENGATIGEMVHFFGERGFGFLMMFFALICIIPLPIPGIHMFLSLPLFYLSLQQLAGRQEIWFTQKVLQYKIPQRALIDVGLKTVPWIEKIEALSKPRMTYLTNPFWLRLFGFIAFYITAFISIPLPLTNLVPAVGITLMSIGILVQDGLALIVGSLIGVVWSLLWFIVLISLGVQALSFAIF